MKRYADEDEEEKFEPADLDPEGNDFFAHDSPSPVQGHKGQTSLVRRPQGMQRIKREEQQPELFRKPEGSLRPKPNIIYDNGKIVNKGDLLEFYLSELDDALQTAKLAYDSTGGKPAMAFAYAGLLDRITTVLENIEKLNKTDIVKRMEGVVKKSASEMMTSVLKSAIALKTANQRDLGYKVDQHTLFISTTFQTLFQKMLLDLIDVVKHGKGED